MSVWSIVMFKVFVEVEMPFPEFTKMVIEELPSDFLVVGLSFLPDLLHIIN